MNSINKTSDHHFLILGLGNLLLQDEGLGIRTLHQLKKFYRWTDDILLMDGGVMGLELLPYIEDSEGVLIIDAIHSGQPAGTLVCLRNGEIPSRIALKYSVHQVGLQETIAMAQLRGTLPKRMVLWGIEPETIALGMRLSTSVASQIPSLIDCVLRELSNWGIVPQKLDNPALHTSQHLVGMNDHIFNNKHSV
jgi:hydrogenase maturation protease